MGVRGDDRGPRSDRRGDVKMMAKELPQGRFMRSQSASPTVTLLLDNIGAGWLRFDPRVAV